MNTNLPLSPPTYTNTDHLQLHSCYFTVPLGRSDLGLSACATVCLVLAIMQQYIYYKYPYEQFSCSEEKGVCHSSNISSFANAGYSVYAV